jgi:16S rRNA U1498 N3-methylase RsmE
MLTITTSGQHKPAAMNIILLRESDWSDVGSVRLSDYRAHHIINILKPELGQSLRIGLVNGNKGSGTVTAMDQTEVQLDVRGAAITPSNTTGVSPSPSKDASPYSAHSG